MQRVVFNAHYLAYCDEAMAGWLRGRLRLDRVRRRPHRLDAGEARASSGRARPPTATRSRSTCGIARWGTTVVRRRVPRRGGGPAGVHGDHHLRLRRRPARPPRRRCPTTSAPRPRAGLSSPAELDRRARRGRRSPARFYRRDRATGRARPAQQGARPRRPSGPHRRGRGVLRRRSTRPATPTAARPRATRRCSVRPAASTCTSPTACTGAPTPSCGRRGRRRRGAAAGARAAARARRDARRPPGGPPGPRPLQRAGQAVPGARASTVPSTAPTFRPPTVA